MPKGKTVTVFWFASLKHPQLRAFTAAPDGSNLPTSAGRWCIGIFGLPLTLPCDRHPVGVAMREGGYFTMSTEDLLPFGNRRHL
jgi:hypothetical protein